LIYTIIGIIILVLVLILLLFLLIPLKLSLNLKKRDSEFKGRFCLFWLGIRIISREIPGEGKKEEKEEKKKDAKKKDEKSKFDLDRILKILKILKESWPHIHRLMITVFQSFTLEKFSLNLTMGLESPADTAMFTGYIWAFTYPLNALTRIKAVITPEFNRRVLDGDLEIDVKLKLIWIVFESIKALTKKPVRQLISEMRSLS
jgi:hypothetical protein